jgi:hypothetical protein
MQTKYGAAFWQATASYRTFRYFPGRSRPQVASPMPPTIPMDIPSSSPSTPDIPAPPPDGGTSNYLGILADQSLGGHRVVRKTATGVNYADSSQIASAGTAIGITIGAVSAGQNAMIAVTGMDIVEPSWNWSPGAIYLGLNGLMTQSAPISGFIQRIGIVTGPTSILVSVEQPLIVS